MATPAKGKVSGGIAFGSLDMYVAGGGLPEGDYIIKDASVVIYQAPANKSTGRTSPSRLGVMLTLVPYTVNPKGGMELGEELTQFYSMGSKAHESFQPNPETGKGIVPVPGGPASNFNNSTNWALFLKSLRDSGMPEGVFSDDSSVLDGLWVHISHIQEPPERATFQSQTGEVAGDRKAGTIAVVSEIKEDGKPWEGGGGMPDTEAAPVKAAVKPNGKPAPVAAKPAAKVAAKAAPASAAAEDAGDEALMASASSAIAAVMEKNPNGCKKLQLRTGVFKYLNDNEDADAAQSVIAAYFSDDATLSNLLGELGYTLKGIDVKAAA